MNLLVLLSYFQTQPKKNYLQLKFEMFDLKQTRNNFFYNMEGVSGNSGWIVESAHIVGDLDVCLDGMLNFNTY